MGWTDFLLRLVPEDEGYYRNGLGVALYQQLRARQAEVDRLYSRWAELDALRASADGRSTPTTG